MGRERNCNFHTDKRVNTTQSRKREEKEVSQVLMNISCCIQQNIIKSAPLDKNNYFLFLMRYQGRWLICVLTNHSPATGISLMAIPTPSRPVQNSIVSNPAWVGFGLRDTILDSGSHIGGNHTMPESAI